MFDARLNRRAIDFLQPVERLLQRREFFRTRPVGQSFTCRFIRLIPLRQEVVEDEARTTDRLRDQDFLLFCRIDSEFVGLVSQHDVHLLTKDIPEREGGDSSPTFTRASPGSFRSGRILA